jgi:hypothetical protein
MFGLAVLGLVSAACSGGGSGETTSAASPSSSVATAVPATEVSSDQALAQAMLLTPDDLDGPFRALPPEGDWPYSAEIARKAPSCIPFADAVFGGGPNHAASATVTLERENSDLYAYVVVFPTREEAAAMMTVVESPAFDECWSEYMGVAAEGWIAGITDAHYSKTTPPAMTFDADRYFTRMVRGTIVIDGAKSGDSCICVFTQVGRAVVLVHSAAEQFNTEDRVAMTQSAIDKARKLIG